MSPEEMLKQRAIIQVCVVLGHTPVQTMEVLNRSTKKLIVAWSLWYTNGISGTVKDGKQ